MEEGYLEHFGNKIWYSVSGNASRPPLVVVHGGPGFAHNYLKHLRILSSDRPVILYDQLGCGASPGNPKDGFSVEYFIHELEALITYLGYQKCHFLGHSWGSIVCVEYALKHKIATCSLTLASPCLSIPLWINDAEKNIKALSKKNQNAIWKAHKEKTFNSQDYQAALKEYYKRHVFRLEERPLFLLESDRLSGAAPYQALWGPNEICLTGSLSTYDALSRVKDLEVPTLITIGKFDEVSEETGKRYLSFFANSELAVFQNSSHQPHLEETEQYLRTVKEYLALVDRDAPISELRKNGYIPRPKSFFKKFF